MRVSPGGPCEDWHIQDAHPPPPLLSPPPPSPPAPKPSSRTPLSATALVLPLCLNGRKEALRVGNGLHQTSRGSERRVTGIQRECWGGEEEQGGGSPCVVGRWGSEEAGGCKLIMDRSMGMLESVSHRICQFCPCQVHCTVYLVIQELSFALRATFSCINI